MWLSKLLQKHFQGHSSSTPGKTRHGTAPSWRRLRLEPLEQRTLLSVAMRVTFWTEDRIDDLGTFVEGQDWPESLGVVDPEFVEELVHIPLWSDPRAGYKTIVRMPVFGDITADEAAATLEQLNFVEHARLESECVVQYGPRSQELIDAITIDHGGGSGHICGDEAPGQAHAIDMRVSLWTQRLIPDVGALVEAQTWPEALGGLDRYQVEELVHIPLWSDPRGGYKTIVRMTVFGDISALEQVDFLDYAKLEAESPFRYTARSQELVDALTWGNSSAAMKPATGGGGATAVRPAEIRDLQADPVDLGVVDFLELTDQASYSGELWYRLEARRPAILTVERGPVPFGAETTLTLYEVDASGNLRQLATDPERIDYADTVQGNEYLVHVSNVRSPVDLRLANLVVTDYIRPGTVKVRHPTGQYRRR